MLQFRLCHVRLGDHAGGQRVPAFLDLEGGETGAFAQIPRRILKIAYVPLRLQHRIGIFPPRGGTGEFRPGASAGEPLPPHCAQAAVDDRHGQVEADAGRELHLVPVVAGAERHFRPLTVVILMYAKLADAQFHHRIDDSRRTPHVARGRRRQRNLRQLAETGEPGVPLQGVPLLPQPQPRGLQPAALLLHVEQQGLKAVAVLVLLEHFTAANHVGLQIVQVEQSAAFRLFALDDGHDSVQDLTRNGPRPLPQRPLRLHHGMRRLQVVGVGRVETEQRPERLFHATGERYRDRTDLPGRRLAVSFFIG